jgi:hypothetical protein
MTQPAPLARSVRELAGAEDCDDDAFGERLRAGGQGDGVGPDHPGAVSGDVAAADGGETQHQTGGQRGPEHEPQHVQQVAGSGPGRVQQGHPQRRDRDQQAGHCWCRVVA